MGFLSSRKAEESEASPHRLRPQYEPVRLFQTKSKTKNFYGKKSDFHLARTCRERQNPKNLIMGFLSNRQPEDSETSPHRLRPQYGSVYSEKIAIFTRRVPVENIKTLKT